MKRLFILPLWPVIRRMRVLAWILGAIGVVMLLLGLLWFGYGLYVRYVVAASPSTASAIKIGDEELRLGTYRGGDQVVPVAAAEEAPTPVADKPTDAPAGPTTGAEATQAASTPAPSRPILPPTRLRIKKIGVDAPVVLADNDNLPRFKAVGWFLGSGFPGFRGNVVLFGHLNGEYETFARLDELRSGDEVVVQAMERTYRYSVTESKIVPREAVEALAPTRDERLTLITCTGTFFPDSRDYSHRLLVIGSLVPE